MRPNFATDGLSWWQRRRLVRRLAAIRRSGSARHASAWEGLPGTLDAQLLEWCRETLAASRRPWGIGHFELRVSCLRPHGGCREMRLRRVLPAELYGTALQERLRHFLAGERTEARVTASIFSWGEAVYLALDR